MNDQPKRGRLEAPVFRGAIWLIASLGGLWFVFRGADPTQIGENLYPYYFFYAAALFLAFEWGRVFGGLYNEWWANYIQVFISVAVPTFAFWLIFGTEAGPPLSDATKANIAATLFLGWLVPALYGVHSRQRSAGKQTKTKSRAAPTIITAEKVVSDYGAFMQSSAFPAPFCIADTKKLPYEKETIKEAIILLMRARQDPKTKEMLKHGYVSLAYFQDGVGEEDLGLDLEKLPKVKDIDFNNGNAVTKVIKQTHALMHSSDKFKEKVENERLLLERDLSEV